MRNRAKAMAIVLCAWAGAASIVVLASAQEGFLATYKGTPYADSRYHGGAQKIPGKIYCAYYDRGAKVWPITIQTPETTAAALSIQPTAPTSMSSA